jgi:SAM-dependent methyltransferase
VVTHEDLARFQNQMKYPRFYYLAERRIRYSLWHHVGTELSGLDRTGVVIDVGAQAGLWGSMIRRHFGCRVLDVDLEYKPGRHGFRIGAPANSIPIESASVSHIVSFCAFNCFEGDDDTAMIHEAARVLVPGGKLVIVPLCIGDEYVNLYDPRLISGVERLDRGARPAAMMGWGNNFGRWYDRHAFETRILPHAGSFDVEIHRISHPFHRQEGFDVMHAARLIRRP